MSLIQDAIDKLNERLDDIYQEKVRLDVEYESDEQQYDDYCIEHHINEALSHLSGL